MRQLAPDDDLVCARKGKYPSEYKAEWAAAARMVADPRTPFLYTYQCPVCAQWHLTSNPRKDPDA